MIRYPSVEDVIALNQAEAGPAGGVRDRDVIESEVHRPQHAFGGVEAYATIWEKAAALLHGLASTQGFHDGNKRTAWVTTETFLEVNGYPLPDIPDIEAESFVMAVAVTAWPDTTVAKAAEWLQAQAEQPRRHPQLDYVFLARAGTMSDDGMFNVLGAGIASLVTTDLPYPLMLTVVARVFWTPADVGRPHGLRAEVFSQGGDEPVGGGGWEWEPPTPSGHVHHPHGLMPSLVALPLLGLIEEAGLYEVRVLLDGEPIASLPYNVVHNAPLELPS